MLSREPAASRVSRVTGAPAKKPVQSKMMSRIKFGSDDEAETEAKAPAADKPTPEAETVTFTSSKDNDDDAEESAVGRRASRRCMYSFYNCFILFLLLFFPSNYENINIVFFIQ